MKVCELAMLLAVTLCLNGAFCRASIVSTFTGGDVGEGLDLDGTFLYAIQGGGNGAGLGSNTVRSATFQVDYNQAIPAQNIPGVIAFGSLVRPTNDPNLINYGATVDDNSLELVMNGYLVSLSGEVGGRDSYEMTVTPGLQYQVQVLLSENFYGTGNPGGNSTTRENSYYLYNGPFTDNVGTGSTVFDSALNVNVINLVGAGNIDSTGVVVTMSFTALSNTVTLAAAPGTTVGPDHVAIINAVTIKAVPEPGTFAMLLFGSMGLLLMRRMRTV